MKKIMKYLPVLFMVFALLVSSCEDELEQLPPEQLSNELSLSTYANLELATNGIYTQLYSANWYGRDFTVIADLKGGNGKSSPLFSGRFQTEYNWANSEGSSSNFFDNAYILIARANNVINAIADFDKPGVTEAQLNQLEGEALFLRALAYFDLVRMYAQPYSYDASSLGVPVVTVTEIGEPARNTVGEVYDQIVSDLTTAEGKIGTPDRGQTDPVGLASKPAVQALLAKVYLYMENWQGAADYATKLIKNSSFSLYTAAEYPTVWSTDAASEVIFEVFGNSVQSGWGGFDEIGYIYYVDGYGDVCASDDLTGLYDANDVRLEVFTDDDDEEVNSSGPFPGFTWPKKYPGKEQIRVNNIVVLRLAEMYLIRAEALYEGADISGATALGDYNAIRTNRGLTETTSAITVNDIYNERRRELCFEGNQLWDLSRTGRGLVRTDYSGAGDANISFPDYKWAMPIPATEMDRNPNMEQNPGY